MSLPQPAFKHPGPVRLAAHATAGASQQQLAHAGTAGRQVHLGITHFEQLELGQILGAGALRVARVARGGRGCHGLAGHQTRVSHGQFFHRGLQLVAGPRGAQLGVQCAAQCGLQPCSQVGVGQRQGQTVGRGLGTALLVGTLRLQGQARAGLAGGQVGAEFGLHRLLQGPVQALCRELQVGECELGWGLLVLPIHTSAP